MSSDGNLCASISHDETVRIWNVEHVKNMRVNAQDKVKSKTLKDRKITNKGKSENFFEDLIEQEEENENVDGDSSDEDEDDSEDKSNESADESEESEESDEDIEREKS
jgi:hypothetical protein